MNQVGFNNKKEIKKAVVYVRVSTEEQVENYSLDNQVGTCSREAELFPELGIKRAKCIQLFPVTSRDRFVIARPRDVSFSPNEEPVDFESYGEAVRHYSDRVGMTQLDLARFSEIDPTHLNKMVGGSRRPPKVEAVLRQIEVLQLNRDEARKLAQLAGYDLDKVLPEQT
jgi:hypothetical protein